MSTPNFPLIAPAINAQSPIGVFDSGVGGLSVLMHLVKILPYENYLYLADTLHVPYGSRSEADIEQLTLQAVHWLKNQGCKLIVIACNSASAFGLEKAREAFPDLPIVGLVPALKPAVLQTKTRQVAVLATPATLSGRLLNQVIESIAVPAGVTVHKYSIASLVPWVEAGMPPSHPAVTQLDALLQQLYENSVDQLVLGCTHYPFFKQYLNEKIQHIPYAFLTKNQVEYPPSQEDLSKLGNTYLPYLNFIDSGQAIAKRVQSLLAKTALLNLQEHTPILQFFATANLTATSQVADRLIHQFQPDWQVQFYSIEYATMTENFC